MSTGAAAVRFIAHPGAGRGAFARRWPPVEAALRARGIDHEVHLTTGPREAHDLGRRARDEGVRLIVAVGGDGTLHEVAGGMLEGLDRLPDGVTLGLVPAGRGSDYARSLDLGQSADDIVARFAAVLDGDPSASRRVDAGEVRYVPTAMVAGRPIEHPDQDDGRALRRFVNESGIGFSTVVAQRTTRFPARLGPWLYTVSGIVTMIDWRHRGLALTWDDGTVTEGRFASVELALGKFTGGGMRLVADVDLSDGLFDVLTIGETGRLEFLTFSWRIRTADHLRSPRCATRRTASLRAEATDGRGPVYLQADGELLGRDPVTFSVLPGAVSVAG